MPSTAESPKDPTPDARRAALISRAASHAARYVRDSDERSVFPTAAAVAQLSELVGPLPEAGRSPEAVLEDLHRVGSAATVVTTHGRYFGFVNGGVDPAAHAASILVGAWDQNVALPVMSPTGACLDEVAAGWVVDALGLPTGTTASFCGGATIANLTALLAARDTLLSRTGWDVRSRGLWGAPRLRVVTSSEIHLSVLKALRLAGFGLADVESVPTDSAGRLRSDAFPRDTDERTLVILQAGNVNTGHSDPFAEVIPRVRARGGWVHVDGAFGLWARASPTRRQHVAGVEEADSWSTDGHKWLNMPYDVGITLVRDRQALSFAMHATASYVTSTAERQPMQLGIQMSQAARGAVVWAALSARGRAGLQELVDSTCDHAAHLALLLEAGGAQVLAPVVLNQALIAFGDDARTQEVLRRVQADGTCWAGGTVWQGRHAMRLSVCDARTTQTDIERSAAAILRCAAAVSLHPR